MRILSRKYTFFLVKLESLKAVWRMHLSRPKFEHQKEMQFEAKKFTWCWYGILFSKIYLKISCDFFVSDGVISDHAIETGFD